MWPSQLWLLGGVHMVEVCPVIVARPLGGSHGGEPLLLCIAMASTSEGGHRGPGHTYHIVTSSQSHISLPLPPSLLGVDLKVHDNRLLVVIRDLSVERLLLLHYDINVASDQLRYRLSLCRLN